MRDIRARIAHRHGIELNPGQILELASRRLEAILDPRNANPALLEQLRKAAGARPESAVSAQAAPPYSFEDTTLYESHRGLLRNIRRLLNPLLRLFFNPNTLVHALNTQARLNAEQTQREAERDILQSEWNALHYELVRRVVGESARLSLEVQALSLRVESLVARADFADRRVGAIEALQTQRPAQRVPPDGGRAQQPVQIRAEPLVAATATSDSSEGLSTEGQRKRRRRRRGRRSGGFGDGAQETMPPGSGSATDSEEQLGGSVSDESEPAPLQGGAAEPAPTPESAHGAALARPDNGYGNPGDEPTS